MKNNTSYLADVAIIRVALIFLLVFYHALCPYTGAWSSPFENPSAIPVYKWLGLFSHYFQLETMVFISGLLFGYGIKRKNIIPTIRDTALRKGKRILLPCLLFSAIYFAMFYDSGMSWYTIVYKVAGGCGHLWFLPMIFWCFMACTAVVSTPPIKVLTASVFMVLCLPLSIIPFGIGSMCRYFIYFYIGYAMMRGMLKVPTVGKRAAFGLFALYLFLTFVTVGISENVHVTSVVVKVLVYALTSGLHLVAALCAIVAIYSVANMKRVKNLVEDKVWIIKLSGYCYGVYIYQQFVLKWLYDKTTLPALVGEVWLPWLAMVITTVVCLLLCHYTLKTRLGRYLIG